VFFEAYKGGVEELGLANDSRKKQTLVIKTQSVEADVQPC